VHLHPRNRRILLERIGVDDTEQEENPLEGFAFPEDFDPKRKGSEIYRVLGKAPDVTLEVENGDVVLIEPNMVAVRTIADKTFYLIQENYVEGILHNE
jgi:co-chaperonin GroES (HSP10)